MLSKIKIIYTCKGCKLKQPLEMPERSVAVDVTLWIELIMQKVGIDHAQRSPECKQGEVDLMIPVSESSSLVGRK